MIGKLNILLVAAVLLAAFAVIAADRDAQRPADPRQTEAVSTVGDAAGLQVAAATTSASRVIPFQGLLTDLSDVPVDNGSYDLVLSLYDAASGGTLLWTETQSAVAVTGGRFSVLLGAVTSLDDPDGDPGTDDAVSFDQPRYLGLAVDPPGGDPLGPEMTPRKEIIPAVRAHDAGNAETVGGHTASVLMPVGTIVAFGGDLQASPPPAGWLKCDGATYSRLEYPELYAAIGTAWGATTESNFRVPKTIGRFLRGVAEGSTYDPDRDARVPVWSGDLYNGNDGDQVGSYQDWATKSPQTDFTVSDPGNHTHTVNAAGDHKHSFDTHKGALGDGWGRVRDSTVWDSTADGETHYAGTHAHSMGGGGSHTHSVSGGDNETRPRNVYVHHIVYAGRTEPATATGAR